MHLLENDANEFSEGTKRRYIPENGYWIASIDKPANYWIYYKEPIAKCFGILIRKRKPFSNIPKITLYERIYPERIQ